MTKKLISAALLLIFVLSLLPAGLFTVFASGATELSVTWKQGGVGGPTHNSKKNQVIDGDTNYRYTDVIVVEKAGTKVWYETKSTQGVSHTYIAVSEWKQAGSVWMLDHAGANLHGTFAYGKSIGQIKTDTGVRYEFVTDKDNQAIRLSYRTDNRGDSDPVVYMEATDEPSTRAQLDARDFTATLNENGKIEGLKWFCGYASSASNTNGSAKEVRYASNAYAHTGLFTVPKAGTKITFTEPGGTNNAYNAFTRYKLVSGRYTYDVGFDAKDALVVSGTTFTYVTQYDNEVLRLCVKSDAQYTDIEVPEPISVSWTATNESGTASVVKKTEWPDAVLRSLLTGAPLIAAKELKDLQWYDGYVGSQYHDSKAFVVTSPTNQVYDYSDVFTVPKAGTTVYFFDQTFTDHDNSKYASTSVMTVSHWKQSGSDWVFDQTKEYLNGCDVYNLLMTDEYRLYAYTTTEDNENLRLCLRYAPMYTGEDEVIPPVYLVEPTDFQASGEENAFSNASYTDPTGTKVDYRIYLPKGYTAEKQYTLVFDNSADGAIAAKLVEKHYNGIVVAYAGETDLSLRLLDEVCKHYPVKISDLLLVGGKALADHAVKFECIRLINAMVVTEDTAPKAKDASFKTLSSFSDVEAAAVWLVEQTEDYYTVLEGLKMYAIGDSYFGGSGLGQHQTWVNLLGYKYGMTFHNYGIGGNTVATAVDQSGNQPPMHTRYNQMPTDGDIYFLEGGRNDRHYSVPFGTNDSMNPSSFKGALNVMIKGIRAKNPDALIVLVTAWSSKKETGYLGTNNDYADAMKELAEYYNDPHIVCMYAADETWTGVDMSRAEFRSKYCLASNDYSHLNGDGMYMVAPKFDKWLAETYAAFKGLALENSAEGKLFLESTGAETEEPEESGSELGSEAPVPTGTQENPEPTESNVASEEPSEGGCQSSLVFPLLLLTVAAPAVILRKKQED